MRIYTAGFVSLALDLSVAGASWADIPPPPPSGLKDSLGLQPIPIALAGLAGAVAVAVAGLGLARARGRPRFRAVSLIVAAGILAVAAVFAYRAAQAWDEYRNSQAEYRKSLVNWRPHGPIQPGAFVGVPRGVAVLAVAPQNSFPHNLPWAALALNCSPEPSVSTSLAVHQD
jgi:hypothetical protein